MQRQKEYHFTFEHRQGIRNTNADALSRRSCLEECSYCRNLGRSDGQLVRIVTTAADDDWDQQALRREQLADNGIGPLIREIEPERRPEWMDISDRGPNYKRYGGQWKSLLLRNGVLVRQ